MADCAARRRTQQILRVKNVEGDDYITLEFNLNGREHKMHRLKQEEVGKTLRRIAITACKDEKEKKHVVRKRAGPTEAELDAMVAQLYRCEQEIDLETPNLEAWVLGSTFVLNGYSYSIDVNTPIVLKLDLPTVLMCGYHVAPVVTLDFEDPDHCKWAWFRCSSKQISHIGKTVKCSGPSSCTVISRSRVYQITPQDYQHHLLLQCTPINKRGEEELTVEHTSQKVIQALPNPPIEQRHQLTPTYIGDPHSFRMVTYNILASYYGSSDYAHELLFSYCSANALNPEYRQCLVAKELLGYCADVICLQEVDKKCFEHFLHPVLQSSGYDGCFHSKAGQIKEGEAVFFNSSRFSLFSEEAVVLRKFVLQDSSCQHLLSLHPLIFKNLLQRHNILQVVVLKSKDLPDNYLCVANTHLFYHPMGDHIRLLQVEVCLKFLESAVRTLRIKVGADAKIAVTFSGDFNSCPCTAAYSYIMRRSVSREHPDWQVYKMAEIPPCNCNHKTLDVIHEDNEHQLQAELKELEANLEADNSDSNVGLDLNHSFNFKNATGTTHATNITSWVGVLDYIFLDSDHLTASRLIPLPPDEQLTEHTALPSVYFPSDHVALVVDVSWNTY